MANPFLRYRPVKLTIKDYISNILCDFLTPTKATEMRRGWGGVERRTGQPIDVEQSDVSCAAFGMSSHR